MTRISILSPGLFTTVQDLGRPGYGTLGISPAGAADPVALRLGNRLVGNREDMAAIEMTLAGGSFLFHGASLLVLTGGDFESTLDGEHVHPWSATVVAAGQVLECNAARTGARCYLCVRGGIDVPLVLGSASTHTRSGIGGVEGRALRAGDVLCTGAAGGTAAGNHVRADALRRLYLEAPIRVTPTLQTEWFRDQERRTFCGRLYRVSEAADRMGLRLEGPAISCAETGRMITEGASLGAVQVPQGGQPIILFVDHQTTGGYPKIANVIAADLQRVGQLRPRDEVRFEWVTPPAARAFLLEMERFLTSDELFE